MSLCPHTLLPALHLSPSLPRSLSQHLILGTLPESLRPSGVEEGVLALATGGHCWTTELLQSRLPNCQHRTCFPKLFHVETLNCSFNKSIFSETARSIYSETAKFESAYRAWWDLRLLGAEVVTRACL